MPKHNTIYIQAAREGVSVTDLIVKTLNSTDTMQQASERLGIKYRTLYRKIRELGITSQTEYFVKEKVN